MTYEVYTVELPENPQAVCFITGIKGNTFKGKLWMWRNISKMRRTVDASAGCIMTKGGICSSDEAILISWWESEAALMSSMKSAIHRSWVRYYAQNPGALTLYNETYHCDRPGKYSKSPRGMALHYPRKRVK